MLACLGLMPSSIICFTFHCATVTNGFTVSTGHLLDYSLYLDENKVTIVD